MHRHKSVLLVMALLAIVPAIFQGQTQTVRASDMREEDELKGKSIALIAPSDFGADERAGWYPNATIVSGSNQLFVGNLAAVGTNNAPGTRICIAGAGVGGTTLCSRILCYNSVPGSFTIADKAVTTVRGLGRGAWWGSDSSAGIQKAINSVSTNRLEGGEIDFRRRSRSLPFTEKR